MKLRLVSFAAATTAAVLSIPTGCGDTPDPEPATGGSATGGTSSGGSATGGTSSGGASGQSTGGVSAGGSGGTTGGSGGAVSGGKSTGGVNAGGSAGASGGISGGSGGGGAGGMLAGAGGKPAAGAGGISGGASTGGNGGGGLLYPATFDTLKALLQSNYGCSGADCHGGNDHNVNLLVNAELYTRLTTVISKCDNLPLVTPGNPAQSALIKILKGPCGEVSQMPDGCMPGEFGNCVKPEEVAPIEQWVLMGAPQ